MLRFATVSLMLAAALSSGCSNNANTNLPPEGARELLGPGSYTVGFRNLELTYPAVWDGADRTLPVRVWYPATDGGEAAADYALTGSKRHELFGRRRANARSVGPALRSAPLVLESRRTRASP